MGVYFGVGLQWTSGVYVEKFLETLPAHASIVFRTSFQTCGHGNPLPAPVPFLEAMWLLPKITGPPFGGAHNKWSFVYSVLWYVTGIPDSWRPHVRPWQVVQNLPKLSIANLVIKSY